MHVAIRMRGRSRWAAEHGVLLVEAHAAGLRAAGATIDAAAGLGIDTLTFDVLPPAAWETAPADLDAVQRAIAEWLGGNLPAWVASNVRVAGFGRRTRLHADVAAALHRLQHATAGGTGLDVHFAFDHSSRRAILDAALDCTEEAGEDCIAKRLAAASHLPDVDLAVRTGGATRLGDFLAWESAYAELWFTPVPWPDFTPAHLAAAVREFGGRARRFGGIAAAQREIATSARTPEYRSREAG